MSRYVRVAKRAFKASKNCLTGNFEPFKNGIFLKKPPKRRSSTLEKSSRWLAK
jgi:hypothetical protein